MFSEQPSPGESGFRMPAEWEPHAATWLTWPRPDGISFPGRYDAVPPVYASLIHHLASVEDVHINVWDAAMERSVRGVLSHAKVTMERVYFHHFPSYEPWCRDHGPIFIVRDADDRRERAIVDWEYNAWGNKYPPFDLDNRIPSRVAEARDLPVYRPGIVMEGGSIEVNGLGTLITTTSCLLNPNRNPLLGQREIERHLKDCLGVRKVIWLGDGIAGDDTDGHVDDMTRFVNATTVVTAFEENTDDVNHEALRKNFELLSSTTDQDGRPFRIVKLPMPDPVTVEEQRLPASYANFYIANGIVLVPVFNQPKDRSALDILAGLFPDRRMIGIDATNLIWGLGAFHCITQQEPK